MCLYISDAMTPARADNCLRGLCIHPVKIGGLRNIQCSRVMIKVERYIYDITVFHVIIRMN